jgi:hypothetical protein
MEKIGVLRHRSIESLTSQQAEKTADAAIELWEQVATQIIAVVGVGGFDSLYARSVFLAQANFPWLTAGAESPQPERRFAQLKARLESATPALASAANCQLLLIFTDTLVSLIGEPLTARLLDSAWGHHALYTAGKDKSDE